MKNKIRVASDEDLKGSDLIVGLSFGKRNNGLPGKSNEYLAEIVGNLYLKYQKPVIVQREIAEALFDLTPDMPVKAIIREHREYKENGKEKKYLDTSEVLIQTKDVCRTNGWNIIILVAHQDHLRRSIKTARNLGFTVNTPLIKDCPYDELSTQKWTRNRWRFKFHEISANIFYLLKGYI